MRSDLHEQARTPSARVLSSDLCTPRKLNLVARCPQSPAAVTAPGRLLWKRHPLPPLSGDLAIDLPLRQATGRCKKSARVAAHHAAGILVERLCIRARKQVWEHQRRGMACGGVRGEEPANAVLLASLLRKPGRAAPGILLQRAAHPVAVVAQRVELMGAFEPRVVRCRRPPRRLALTKPRPLHLEVPRAQEWRGLCASGEGRREHAVLLSGESAAYRPLQRKWPRPKRRRHRSRPRASACQHARERTHASGNPKGP
mmetsp:Transcript_152742/g.489953  ORF Transcript_152742/g.489953 Transcript_152742/m.489953 type:complete len:257 (-) Transcript_152742:7-777(-)